MHPARLIHQGLPQAGLPFKDLGMKRSFELNCSRPGPAGAEEDPGAELEAAARGIHREGRSRIGLLAAFCSRISTLGVLSLLSRLEGSSEDIMAELVMVGYDADPAATNAVPFPAVST
jgi:hypothetical protein